MISPEHSQAPTVTESFSMVPHASSKTWLRAITPDMARQGWYRVLSLIQRLGHASFKSGSASFAD